jgi:hypothetical protein
MMDDPACRAAKRLWPEHDATAFGYFDHLHANGSPLEALFYSGLFWPSFVEVEGMVFLKHTVEDEADRERVRAALRACNDPCKVERDFNRVEVPCLFGRRLGETTDDEDTELAGVLAKTWAAALREQFPGKTFRVSVWPASEGEEIAIGFDQG